MPHVSEVRATDHDLHDLMLVAALAAGDLAGTDRDQAIAQADSCAECSALRDDLVAIARATASVPPPIRAAGRDFRLTPERAASLRPTGWRRFVPSGGRGAFTRPLGAALATFGIAGILIGTLSLGFTAGSSASAPQPAAGSGTAADRNAESLIASGAPQAPGNLQPLPETSAAAASAAAAPAPAASAAAAAPSTPADTTGGGFGTLDGGVPAASAPTSVGIAAAPSTGRITQQETTSTTSAADGSSGRSWSPLLIVSAIALVIGVALLVLARRRENELR